jgi:hypothetical protein
LRESAGLSGTLIVWKAPIVEDEKAAARLLKDYYARGDDAAFEPSGDVATFYDEIVATFPIDSWEADEPPIWAGAPHRSDRVVMLDYSWSAPDAFLDEIQRLARVHELVLYDPQGPDVHLPNEPPVEPYVPTARDTLRVARLGLIAVAVAIGAWLISVPILSWVVIGVAGVVLLASVLGLYGDVHAVLRQRRR